MKFLREWLLITLPVLIFLALWAWVCLTRSFVALGFLFGYVMLGVTLALAAVEAR